MTNKTTKQRHAGRHEDTALVLGDAWVDAANAKRTDFDSDFQDFITGAAWSDVWSRPTFRSASARW
jgi:4-carboxymuconolactone decarboxylase